MGVMVKLNYAQSVVTAVAGGGGEGVVRKARVSDIPGLKKLRLNTAGKTPDVECGNCRCKRYSACGCRRRK